MGLREGTESWAQGAEEFRGQRLLPDIVDYYAHEQPDRVFAAIPRSGNVTDGFEDVTMKTMAAAVNYTAWWIDRAFEDVFKRTTLAYVGPSDLRYPIVLLALMKCGWSVMYISPQNTPIQNLGLLQEADVHGLIYADVMSSIAENLQQFDPFMSSLQLPGLTELLKSEAPPYHFGGTFAELQDKRCLTLHTSGTTGQPKLVHYTHGTLACADNDQFMPVPKGRRPQNASQFNFSPFGRYYAPYPPYHLAGLHAATLVPIFSNAAAFVMGPHSVPPSGSLMKSILQQQPQIRAIYVPPFMLEQWMVEPGAFDEAQRLDFILYGGGALAPSVGHKLSQATEMRQMYGSVEFCHVQVLVPLPGEWEYLEFNPSEGYEMQAVGDGVYELVLHQYEESRKHQSFAHNYPNLRKWHTKDLFVPHPEKTNLWRFHSRTEDIVVLENKSKVWPIPMEAILRGNPHIGGALIVGNGRPEPVLLIEPRQSCAAYTTKEEMLDVIWSSVQEANSIAPPYAKIDRSRIVLCPSQVGFFRTPKGTVMRKPTESLYVELISAAFKEDDDDSGGDDLEYTGDQREVELRGDQLLAAT
ncbi:AMP dependent ligase/synthetase [Aspergillus heteromorphus CBS 117.55]|uniref:AMP dependent ligase/synthetase n=1 Tax=Aspergillus heteromorphus CBS 117.55 TaxID=1448321 RepID=A0A317X4S3_9EURO|nr:AMP dependent ligase/synthetase [Aspergillus heteromorphus CBS 117.55]PWY92517.1 AMP dependent ligase/synthetase [Aspergillus heteromorphus CBS 117.55]